MSGTRFVAGWILCVIAGFFPLCVGSVLYLSVLTAQRFDALPAALMWLPMLSENFAMKAADPDGPGFVYGHIGFANLMATGAAISALSWKGIRSGQRWAWVTTAGVLLWAGGNDAAALLMAGVGPIPFAPLILGGAGLALTAPEIFRGAPA